MYCGSRRSSRGRGGPVGAVNGVVQSGLQMLETGGADLGVATDDGIESFRNEMWAAYKAGAGIDAALRRQFAALEEGLEAMGVAVWPMVELEADDGLASAAHLASQDESVQRVSIWTPDKDLAQCVRGDRVVQRSEEHTSELQSQAYPVCRLLLEITI